MTSAVMDHHEAKDRPYCSFCGRSDEEVGEMVVGPCVFICADCIEICADVIRNRRKAAAQPTSE